MQEVAASARPVSDPLRFDNRCVGIYAARSRCVIARRLLRVCGCFDVDRMFWLGLFFANAATQKQICERRRIKPYFAFKYDFPVLINIGFFILTPNRFDVCFNFTPQSGVCRLFREFLTQNQFTEVFATYFRLRTMIERKQLLIRITTATRITLDSHAEDDRRQVRGRCKRLHDRSVFVFVSHMQFCCSFVVFSVSVSQLRLCFCQSTLAVMRILRSRRNFTNKCVLTCCRFYRSTHYFSHFFYFIIIIIIVFGFRCASVPT
jgi:hypothetical protein